MTTERDLCERACLAGEGVCYCGCFVMRPGLVVLLGLGVVLLGLGPAVVEGKKRSREKKVQEGAAAPKVVRPGAPVVRACFSLSLCLSRCLSRFTAAAVEPLLVACSTVRLALHCGV